MPPKKAAQAKKGKSPDKAPKQPSGRKQPEPEKFKPDFDSLQVVESLVENIIDLGLEKVYHKMLNKRIPSFSCQIITRWSQAQMQTEFIQHKGWTDCQQSTKDEDNAEPVAAAVPFEMLHEPSMQNESLDKLTKLGKDGKYLKSTRRLMQRKFRQMILSGTNSKNTTGETFVTRDLPVNESLEEPLPNKNVPNEKDLVYFAKVDELKRIME